MTDQNSRHTKTALNEAIRVLCVLPHSEMDELASILSTTQWRVSVTNSVRNAIEAIRSTPTSVILREETLHDATWPDLVEARMDSARLPEIIVLSAHVDMHLWAEVLNCGTYDLLAPGPSVPGKSTM